jgi:hypothetical protein
MMEADVVELELVFLKLAEGLPDGHREALARVHHHVTVGAAVRRSNHVNDFCSP